MRFLVTDPSSSLIDVTFLALIFPLSSTQRLSNPNMGQSLTSITHSFPYSLHLLVGSLAFSAALLDGLDFPLPFNLCVLLFPLLICSLLYHSVLFPCQEDLLVTLICVPPILTGDDPIHCLVFYFRSKGFHTNGVNNDQ